MYLAHQLIHNAIRWLGAVFNERMTMVSVFLSVAIINGLIVLAIVQDYCAKHRCYSRIYWRNWPKLNSCVFRWAHARHLDHLMSFAKILFATDFTIREYWVFIRMVPDLYRIKKCVAKLDYIVDSSKAADVFALGKPALSSKLSPFLKKLLDRDDVACLEQCVHQQLISENELCAFGNLLANKLFCQAELTLQYNRADDRQQKAWIREQLARCNLQISGVYLTLIIHFVKKDKQVKAIVNRARQNGLSYKHLQQIYPAVIRAGELMQIAHDVVEFRYDLQEELIIGKINANYFLAKLESANLLVDTMTFNNLPSRAVSLYELPQALQTVFLETSHYYSRQLLKGCWRTRMVYSLLWEYEKQVGFFVKKPHRYQKDNADYQLLDVKEYTT